MPGPNKDQMISSMFATELFSKLMPINDFSFEYLGVLPEESKPDWYALNQCKDCHAMNGCGGMNGKCPYSKER